MRLSLRTAVLTVALLGGAASIAAAQGAPTATVDSLRRTVAALTARLDSLEAGHCPTAPLPAPAKPRPTGNAAVDSLAATVAVLTARVNATVAARCAPAAAPAPVPAAADTTDPLAAIRAAADSAAVAAGAPAAGDTTGAGPTEFVSRQRNQSSMNPEISATGDVQFSAETGQRRARPPARGGRSVAAGRARSLLRHQDLPHLGRGGDRRRGGVHLLDRAPGQGPRGPRQVPDGRGRSSTGGTPTRCPKPTIRSSTRRSWARTA